MRNYFVTLWNVILTQEPKKEENCNNGTVPNYGKSTSWNIIHVPTMSQSFMD